MKKIIIASFLAMLGFVGVAKAEYTYLVTQSTCVFLSSSSNIELLSVEVSTGNGVDYCLVIATNAVSAKTTGEFATVARDGGLAVYPVSQWATTQMIGFSTNTMSSVGICQNKWNFEDSRGDGLRPKNGILIWQSAVGNTVKIRVRKFR